MIWIGDDASCWLATPATGASPTRSTSARSAPCAAHPAPAPATRPYAHAASATRPPCGVGNFKPKTVTFRKGASITVKVPTHDRVCTDSAPLIDRVSEYGYATVAILADLTSAMTADDKYYNTETFEVYETSRGVVDVYSIDAETWTASAVQSWTARVYG
jgi:hypothetical protein